MPSRLIPVPTIRCLSMQPLKMRPLSIRSPTASPRSRSRSPRCRPRTGLTRKRCLLRPAGNRAPARRWLGRPAEPAEVNRQPPRGQRTPPAEVVTSRPPTAQAATVVARHRLRPSLSSSEEKQHEEEYLHEDAEAVRGEAEADRAQADAEQQEHAQAAASWSGRRDGERRIRRRRGPAAWSCRAFTGCKRACRRGTSRGGRLRARAEGRAEAGPVENTPEEAAPGAAKDDSPAQVQQDASALVEAGGRRGRRVRRGRRWVAGGGGAAMEESPSPAAPPDVSAAEPAAAMASIAGLTARSSSPALSAVSPPRRVVQ